MAMVGADNSLRQAHVSSWFYLYEDGYMNWKNSCNNFIMWRQCRMFYYHYNGLTISINTLLLCCNIQNDAGQPDTCLPVKPWHITFVDLLMNMFVRVAS